LKKGGARPAGSKKLLILPPAQDIKVFCFFFSKKKCLLSHRQPRHPVRVVMSQRSPCDMITLEAVGLPDGRFGVRSIGSLELYDEADEFDTRAEAEEWIFNRVEQLDANNDPHTLTPGTGQGPR